MKLIQTPYSIISIVNFDPIFVYWTNSECHVLIQNLHLNFDQSEEQVTLHQSCCFSQETPSQAFS